MRTSERPLLGALLLLCRRSSAFHRAVCRLIRPKLEVIRPVAGLTDLPRHPRDAQTIEDINVILQDLCLVLTGSTKLFEQYVLP